ncbi:hypothetical protein NPIL_314041 [Nephila pilipes]|uniref:Uncharacterized protein n=1 Tax=Nephila pilipes TaxID=299642 RepID=A0A8X6TX23_NEPPI|nr:hypothetical protein NPIL_314041 [Nephila pilipes]
MEEHLTPNNTDANGPSQESPHIKEKWLQLGNEDNRLLLESMDSTFDYIRRMQREGKFKSSKEKHSNALITRNKTAVTAARKQSKELLEKICKKIFHQKNSQK